MKNGFPLIPLRNVIQHRKEFVEIDEFETYKRCRVQLHAKGVVLRDIITGSEIKTKKQQICRAGEFLVAEIDAKVGGFGVVPTELDEAIVSSHYFLFEIDENVLDRRFLDYFVRTPAFRDQVSAQGSTNYAAIRPTHVLEYKVPIPPLSEQNRIVTRVGELAARIEEARELRRKAVEEAEALLGSAQLACFTFTPAHSVREHSFSELSTILRGRGPTYLDGTGNRAVNQKCVRWNGVDIAHTKEVSDDWISALPRTLFLQEDDLLVNSTGEGTIGRACIVTPNAIGLPFDSHILVVRPERTKAAPRFLAYFLRSPCGRAQIEDAKGAKTTKQTELGVQKLGKIPVPIPSIDEQQRIVAYLDDLQAKMDSLKQLQAKTAVELDVLLPSVLDRAFKGNL